MEEIIYTKEYAKEQLKKGNYSIAKCVLEKIWNESNKNDVYLLFDYGQVLRKVQESIKFVEICRNPIMGNFYLENQCIKSTLCWCLYDCYIKNYKYDSKEEKKFKEFLKRADYIIKNTEQLDADKYCLNPYVITVKKVVKIYNSRPTKNYKEILKWLDYLKPDKLSEEEFNFKDENGIDRELASMKEFFYQNKIKALEKTEDYLECIKICNIALKEIQKFHYRNKTWIKARLYFCKCMEPNNIQNDIEEYKQLAYRENYWFMYHKLSQICFRYDKMEQSLLYASKAIECKFEHEKMVNLFLDIALLWEQLKCDKTKSKIYYQASAYYRNKYGWNIPEELKYAINVYGIDIEQKPEISKIKSIANSYILEIEEKDKIKGNVKFIFSHGGSGFITPNIGENDIYFNMNDVIDRKKLLPGDTVTYSIGKNKKNENIAIKVKKRG